LYKSAEIYCLYSLGVQAGENKITLWNLNNYLPGPNRFLNAEAKKTPKKKQDSA